MCGDGPGADSGGPGIGATSGNMGWDNAGAPVGEAGSPGWDIAAASAQAQADTDAQAQSAASQPGPSMAANNSQNVGISAQDVSDAIGGFESAVASAPALGFESAVANGTFDSMNDPGFAESAQDLGGGVFGDAGFGASAFGQGHLGSQLNGFTGLLGSPVMSGLNMAVTAANPALGLGMSVGRSIATNDIAGLGMTGLNAATFGVANQAVSALGALSTLSGFVNGPTIGSVVDNAISQGQLSANQANYGALNGFSAPTQEAATATATNQGGLLGGSSPGPSGYGGSSGGYVQSSALPQSGILAPAAPASAAPIMQAQQPAPFAHAGLLNEWRGNQLYIPPYGHG